MSTNLSPTSLPKPSSPAQQPCERYEVQTAADLSDIANALSPQLWTSGSKQSLADLVNRLEQMGYFRVFFLPHLATYDWGSHDRDPSAVVNKVMQLRDSPIYSRPEDEGRWFSDSLARWRCYISTEMDMLIPLHGEHFLWFPEKTTQRVAFAYVLFLFMCLRSGDMPAIMSRLYIDALGHLGECGCNL